MDVSTPSDGMFASAEEAPFPSSDVVERMPSQSKKSGRKPDPDRMRARCFAVLSLKNEYKLTTGEACQVLGISKATYFTQKKLCDQDAPQDDARVTQFLQQANQEVLRSLLLKKRLATEEQAVAERKQAADKEKKNEEKLRTELAKWLTIQHLCHRYRLNATDACRAVRMSYEFYWKRKGKPDMFPAGEVPAEDNEMRTRVNREFLKRLQPAEFMRVLEEGERKRGRKKAKTAEVRKAPEHPRAPMAPRSIISKGRLLPASRKIPHAGRQRSALEVLAFIDDMIEVQTRRETIPTEALVAFGLTRQLCNLLIILRDRLVIAVVWDLPWHNHGLLDLPVCRPPDGLKRNAVPARCDPSCNDHPAISALPLVQAPPDPKPRCEEKSQPKAVPVSRDERPREPPPPRISTSTNVIEAMLDGDYGYEPNSQEGYVPTEAIPGTREKLGVMEGRADRGNPSVFHPKDVFRRETMTRLDEIREAVEDGMRKT